MGIDKTEAQVIFENLYSGEIPHEKALELNALLAAKTIQDHSPMYYPKLPPGADDYLNGRLAGRVELNFNQALTHASWINAMVKAFQSNLIEQKNLKTWIDRCKKIEDYDAVAALQDMLERHDRNPFPFSDFEKALRVQEMDSTEKKRNFYV